jgi:tol-pal system protein YbgF
MVRLSRLGSISAAVAVLLSGLLMLSAQAGEKDLERRIDDLDARLSRIERLLKNAVLHDMMGGVKDLQRQVQELRGENEQIAHELDGMRSRQRELYLDVDRRLQAFEGGRRPTRDARAPMAAAPAAPAKPPPASLRPSATPAAGPVTAGPSSDSGQEAYKQAFNLLKERRYEQATSAFRRFLEVYPNSPYRANAQYWLAEANYVSRNYPVAATEFQKVIEDHSDSGKLPDASLKLGFTYYEMGEWEKARQALTEVQEKYPNSTVSRLAAQRLQRMQQEGH